MQDLDISCSWVVPVVPCNQLLANLLLELFLHTAVVHAACVLLDYLCVLGVCGLIVSGSCQHAMQCNRIVTEL